MKYIYMLAGDEHEHDLALVEALALSGGEACGAKVVQADRLIDLARTGYTACGLELLASGEGAAETAGQIREQGLAADGFAIEVRRIPRGLKVGRHEVANELALVIDGSPNLDSPSVQFLALVTDERVWFGRKLEAGEPEWQRFAQKPHDFSSALPSQAARAICNILVRGGERVIDPCCGTGTFLLHAASLGAHTTGCDINKKMVGATNKNLKHFGFEATASIGDAADVAGSYDLVLANVPYGKMTATSDERLAGMVANIATLAPRGAIVATSDLSDVIRGAGAEVRQVLRLAKFSITRRIFIFERAGV